MKERYEGEETSPIKRDANGASTGTNFQAISSL